MVDQVFGYAVMAIGDRDNKRAALITRADLIDVGSGLDESLYGIELPVTGCYQQGRQPAHHQIAAGFLRSAAASTRSRIAGASVAGNSVRVIHRLINRIAVLIESFSLELRHVGGDAHVGFV